MAAGPRVQHRATRNEALIIPGIHRVKECVELEPAVFAWKSRYELCPALLLHGNHCKRRSLALSGMIEKLSATTQYLQSIMEPTNRRNGGAIRFKSGIAPTAPPFSGQSIMSRVALRRAVAPDEDQVPNYQRRMRHVQVAALTDNFLKAIPKIAEGSGDPLAGD